MYIGKKYLYFYSIFSLFSVEHFFLYSIKFGNGICDKIINGVGKLKYN